MSRVAALSQGFRSRYLTSAAREAQLSAWAEAFPDLVRVTTLALTPGGRPLQLVTVGKDPERARPALWVDGNMHALELTGQNVCLGVVEDLLKLHVDGDTLGLPAAVVERLRDALVLALPCMSPDGADEVLASGRFVRSLPQDDDTRHAARFVQRDLDGDGRVLRMRRRDPAGQFVESETVPHLMVPRTVDDDGPYYSLYPEAVIENFDGHTVPSWGFFDDNPFDLNRTFPFRWAPVEDQVGAGPYSGAAVETRAVLEAATARPHLMAWFNLHTFGGVFIRPRGDVPDSKMDRGDLAVFEQLQAWATTHTGYPTVSGFEEFTYVPEKPLCGDLADYAYHQRGCLAVAVELWDYFAQVGLPRRKPFVDAYRLVGRAEQHQMAAWDGEHNQGRTLVPWTPVEHPQLGPVEVGGLDVRVGIWNPPEDRLARVVDGMSQVLLRTAALLPRLRVTTTVEPLADGAGDGGTRAVHVVVENDGYLATYGIPSAKKLQLSQPVVVRVVQGAAGAAPVVGSDRHDIGHLGGYGHGAYPGGGAWPYQASEGEPSSKRVTFVVGRGSVTVRVGSPRVGFVDVTVP